MEHFYYALLAEGTRHLCVRWRQGSHSSLQGAVKTRLQMESSAFDIIARPPTPLRSDGEISNSPSIDQCQVVAKVFVKFVSTRSCSTAYKASYSVDCSVLCLRGNIHSVALCRVAGQLERKPPRDIYSVYKFNLAFERKLRTAVTRDNTGWTRKIR